jgi:cell division protein FtsB
MRFRFVSQNFGIMVIPAICLTVSGYFGYSAVFGERGLLAWNSTEAELAIASRDLAGAQAARKALEHRIALLDEKALDPDLLEEVARGMLYQGREGEVSVPRTQGGS